MPLSAGLNRWRSPKQEEWQRKKGYEAKERNRGPFFSTLLPFQSMMLLTLMG